MKQLIFAALLLAAFGFFATTLHRYIRVMLMGGKDPRPRFDRIGTRLWKVLLYFVGQRKVAERQIPPSPQSYHHLIIFWGFLLITVGTAETLVAGVWPGFSYARFLGSTIAGPLRAVIDVFNLLVLAAIGYAFFRRIVVKPRLIPMSLDAGLILSGIGTLMITHFAYHGLHAVAAGAASVADAPISSAVAGILGGLPRGAAHTASEISYWIHVVAVLAFLNYLPYSKHIHLLGALPNILTMNLGERRLDLPRLDLEDENQWGVGRFQQLSWKSLLDTYACTECARCTNYCPAYATKKPLSPMQLIHDVRYEMLERGSLLLRLESLRKELATLPPRHAHAHADGAEAGAHAGADGAHAGADGAHAGADGAHAGAPGGHAHDAAAEEAQEHPEHVAVEARIAATEKLLAEMPPMTGGRILEETLWACTTCGACHDACPVFIEHPLKIVQMRQNLVLAQEKTPADVARMFRNLERNGNPWGVGADARLEWAEGLEVPTVETRPNPEYLFWVGCAGAFDQRLRKQTRALVRILDAAGVDYAILGERETCTGDAARRAGNEMLFQMMAEANVETLKQFGFKKLLVQCPHCYHTFKHDYPQFGGTYEVVHHSQLLASLLAEGKLELRDGGAEKVVFHDSCYLGRWNCVYEAPRQVLAALPSVKELAGVTRERDKGFCCGAGGGRMFMEEPADGRVNVNRTEELVASGAATVAVACPFCNVMITDGLKAMNREEDVKVLDLSELVARSLVERPQRPRPVKADDGAPAG